MLKQNNSNNAIGVFDSGLGGLTVVKELIKLLPNEDIIYFGDTARVPYGTKSKEAIVRFSRENTKVLLEHKVKMIVVACNSSSSYALAALKKEFNVPIVGVIRPGAKKAVETSRNNKIGVIATSATVTSLEYEKNIKRYSKKAKVVSRACPLFVPLAEEGWADKVVTLTIAKKYLAPLKRSDIDTLILGCTHYPLLKKAIQQAAGKKVTLVDSAKEVAEEVKNALAKLGKQKISKRKARYQFLISDRPQAFKKLAKNFLGRDIKNIVKV